MEAGGREGEVVTRGQESREESRKEKKKKKLVFSGTCGVSFIQAV
jgi:hypothetical protein